MPLEAIEINNFDTSLMRESIHQNEFKMRIQALYEDDREHHQFSSGSQAITALQQAFDNQQSLYVGMFNDKPICAVGCYLQLLSVDLEQSAQNRFMLNNLAMHKENKNRGIEEQFVKLIIQKIENQTKKYGSDNSLISEIIKNIKIIEKSLDRSVII